MNDAVSDDGVQVNKTRRFSFSRALFCEGAGKWVVQDYRCRCDTSVPTHAIGFRCRGILGPRPELSEDG